MRSGIVGRPVAQSVMTRAVQTIEGFGVRERWIEEVTSPGGHLSANGVVSLSGKRVSADWTWQGERPAIHSYAKKAGYIAVRYKDELFEVTQNKAHFRWFGVVESKVQQNLTIILQPTSLRRSQPLGKYIRIKAVTASISQETVRRELLSRYPIGD